jgi:hypothetical protein
VLGWLRRLGRRLRLLGRLLAGQRAARFHHDGDDQRQRIRRFATAATRQGDLALPSFAPRQLVIDREAGGAIARHRHPRAQLGLFERRALPRGDGCTEPLRK